MALGVALADNPAGPFQDSGQPLLVGDPGFRDLDPMRFVDPATGQQLLFFGSGFGPLRVRELAADGLAFAPDSYEHELVQAAGDGYGQLVEGAWVHRRGGWYYLFYFRQQLLPARGALRRAGGPRPPRHRSLPDAGRRHRHRRHHPGRGRRWLAPGHNSVVTDGQGQDWLLCHAIDRRQPTFDAINDEQGRARRVLMLYKLEYSADSWPVVTEQGNK